MANILFPQPSRLAKRKPAPRLTPVGQDESQSRPATTISSFRAIASLGEAGLSGAARRTSARERSGARGGVGDFILSLLNAAPLAPP